jgi:uncharacterized Tic20 family protein
MQPPDQPAPGEPNPVPPPQPPVCPTPPASEPGPLPTPPPGPGEPPPMAGASGSNPRYNFGSIPSPTLGTAATSDEKLWGLFIHLGGAFGHITSYFHVPGGNLLVPLVLWLIKKDESPFLNDQGKEVVNFQICIFILNILCFVTCILIPVAWVLSIVAMVLGIVGGVKANEGVAYRYPFNFRIIK